MVLRKKLIEVALPLDAINKASAREKSIRHGHPSTLHLWWARRPLAAARAVIFAQMVDDPSSLPDLFSTEKAQEKERKRLFKIIEELVLWENTTNEDVLERAREEIRQSWRRACGDNAEDPAAEKLFNQDVLPAFHDPFAGGGTLPLEAQRLGFYAVASDLNSVAVLINSAMIDIPPRFAGRVPVNPDAQADQSLIQREGKGAEGLADDIRFYGKWVRDEAEERIGQLYPTIEVTDQIVAERPDLRSMLGQKLPAMAWLWARTVRSPNPAFSEVDVPLVSTFMLSTKKGKESYVQPVIGQGGYEFRVCHGTPDNPMSAKAGTRAGKRAAFRCLMSGVPISFDYIRSEGKAGRLGRRLMAIVADGIRGRVYLSPTGLHESIANRATPSWQPDVALEGKCKVNVGNYGFEKFGQLFTDRQLVSLSTISDLIHQAMGTIRNHALAAGMPGSAKLAESADSDAIAYSQAVVTYLAFALSKLLDRSCSLVTWFPSRDSTYHAFGRQAIPMTWDFAETNVLLGGSGSYQNAVDWVAEVVESFHPAARGKSILADAQVQTITDGHLVSTDPPYYDNIGYADLSDFFYVWLRRTLRGLYTELFATVAVPKTDELVATPYRHGSKKAAESFFVEGMTKALAQLSKGAHPALPVTIYYAFKQAETDSESGTASTGWETFLAAVIQAGFSITGTWPVRTELGNRINANQSNALASSVILVCRVAPSDVAATTRREFVAALQRELPKALQQLQAGNIAPVDLAQAAIGPGMAVYTRYARVLDAEGKPLLVREALSLINRTLDEALTEQEGDFDADTRWALAWFEQSGFKEGDYGIAETLSKAKNTSVGGLEVAGILESKKGKVRLFSPAELPADWNPETDKRLTAWETVHHLIRALEDGGESAAATLVAKLGSKAEPARELAYRLYALCEHKKRAAEALSYNGLVQSWPEIVRLASETRRPQAAQTTLFDESEG